MITVTKKFSQKLIKVMIATILVFVAVVLAYNWFGKQVQTELILSFFGAFVGEFGFMAWIKTKERKKKVQEQEVQ